MSTRITSLLIAMIAGVTAINASVPIIVGYGKGRRAVMNLFTNAEDRLKHGDTAGAKRDLDTALHADPTFWPALYIRAQIFAGQGKYELAIQDCNEALRQYPGFVEAALLRASIYVRLGKYAEALKEFNYIVSIHPRSVTLARALSDRAWFQATCSNASFRNGRQAVKDAKAACSIMAWKDENMIDTLGCGLCRDRRFWFCCAVCSASISNKGNRVGRFETHSTASGIIPAASADSIIKMESRFEGPRGLLERYCFAESPSLKACSEKDDPQCKMSGGAIYR